MQSFEEWDQSDSFEIKDSESAPRNRGRRKLMTKTKDADRGSRACDGYQAFRVAGELFGRLQHELGFGELIMRTPSWGPSAPPAAMSYDWSFNAKGERYVVSETVSFVELIHLRSVEAFAVSVAARWKEQAKQRAGTESA